MNHKPTKGDKAEIRRETRMTRAPRLESSVKEAMMQPKKKPKRAQTRSARAKKPYGPSARVRKDYQLKGPRH